MSEPNPVLKNKTILVTGASRGIGRAIATACLDAGATVYGTARKRESLDWLREEKEKGRPAHLRAFDVASRPDWLSLVKEIGEAHGQLDCLINNAGISSNTPAGSFKDDEIQRIIDTNFRGVFLGCQAYYRAQKRKGGNIINIASILGLYGTPLASVYSGTKGAVLQLTRSLAVEWARNGFRLNAICPGFIDTDMTETIKGNDQIREYMLQSIPIGRLGRPDDIAPMAVFLASDASAYMTGSHVVIDGGLSMKAP